jgi:putative SOS response-associated peptidase YedK
MCGRFIVNEDALAAAERITPVPSWIQEKFRFGTIYPSQSSLVLKQVYEERSRTFQIKADLLPFGFRSSSLKKQMINARADSVLTKPMYRKAAAKDRCVVVCSRFYEWTPEKKPYLFFLPDQTMFLAGLVMEGGFLIITTDANESVKDIHHRMPVILNEKEAEDFLKEKDSLKHFLTEPSPYLKSVPAFQQYETLTLF